MTSKVERPRRSLGQRLAGPLATLVEGYLPPSDSKIGVVMSTVGLPWEGSNKQARMRFALESATAEEAIDAVERVLELLSTENGAFIRAIKGTPKDDERQIARAVTDTRSVLQAHGLDLDDEGRLCDEIGEATAATPALRPTQRAATHAPQLARDTVTSTTGGATMSVQPANARSVFLVHGRDKRIKSAMTDLLRAFDLRVIDWEEAAAAANSGSPSTLEIVHAGMSMAHGVVVLFTADDLGQCKEEFLVAGDGSDERDMTGQARQNVMFEAGMAIGIDQKRTVLVHHGRVRWNSDLQSVNYVSIDDSHQSRLNLGRRLRTAGLTVHLENSHFNSAGDFSAPTASHPHSSDPTSQPEPPPGLKADINTMLEWMYDPTQRGKLQQLVQGRVHDLDKAVNALEVPSDDPGQTALLSYYNNLFELSAPLVELLQRGVSHDREDSCSDVWSRALQQMMRIRRPPVMPPGQMIHRHPLERVSRARHVPAMLTLRTIGLTAVLASRDHPGADQPSTRLWMELGKLPWHDPDASRCGIATGIRTTLDLLDEHEVLDASAVHDHVGLKFSMSRYIRALLHPVFEEVCLDDTEWQDLNDQFEYRRALLYSRADRAIPPMRASGEQRWSSGGWQPELRFLDEVDLDDPASPWSVTDMGEPMVGEMHLELVRQAARRQLH